MTLPELRKAYHKKGEEIDDLLNQVGDMMDEEYIAGREKQRDYYFKAGNHVQLLIDQGPLPTGQEWNLEGRYIPATTWGVSNAKEGK